MSTKPGVQKPHWKAPHSMKASCTASSHACPGSARSSTPPRRRRTLRGKDSRRRPPVHEHGTAAAKSLPAAFARAAKAEALQELDEVVDGSRPRPSTGSPFSVKSDGAVLALRSWPNPPRLCVHHLIRPPAASPRAAHIARYTASGVSGSAVDAHAHGVVESRSRSRVTRRTCRFRPRLSRRRARSCSRALHGFVLDHGGDIDACPGSCSPRAKRLVTCPASKIHVLEHREAELHDRSARELRFDDAGD